MLTFNEEHEQTILIAISYYTAHCKTKVNTDGAILKAAWIQREKEAHSALTAINRYLNNSELLE